MMRCESPLLMGMKRRPFDILPTAKAGGFRYHQLMPQKKFKVLQSLLRWTMPRPYELRRTAFQPADVVFLEVC